jgi:hypothetical protein
VNQQRNYSLQFLALDRVDYSLRSILVVADLVQGCTKSATTNMEQREYKVNRCYMTWLLFVKAINTQLKSIR